MNYSTYKSSHPYNMETRPTCSQKKLATYSRTDLTKLRDKNAQMLSNQSVIDTLPDKGAKLKETNQMIEALLVDSSTARSFDEITVSNTSTMDCPLTKKLEDMSVLTPRQGARKRSVDHANELAYNHYSSSRLLSKPKRSHGNCPSIFYNNYHTRQPAAANVMCDKAKVRMLTLDESVSLQTEQRSSVINSEKSLDLKHPSKSLLKSLNLSIDVIQEVDINDVELPAEESEDDDDFEAMLLD
ncbi:hypothetical protein BD770DRAFT_409724 [Pilaira anomala]|nr:hypothetical protein BD770DRAFT_409724 [Pilaira anomala]